jgi:hypothetical protein
MNIGAMVAWFQTNWFQMAQAIAAIIGAASIIVKMTPTIKDNEVLEKIIKFVGKYIALNRTVDDDAIRSTTSPK